MENHVAVLDDLFKQAGAVADLLAIDVYPDEAMWHVAIDEETILFAELDVARGLLVMSTDVGSPRENDQATVQALALRYNFIWFIWPESGGARLGMDGEGSSVWLLMDMAAGILDVELLGSTILRFGEMARAWRTIIATGHNASTGQSLQSDAVRVVITGGCNSVAAIHTLNF